MIKKNIKIAAILEKSVNSGGGFNQALNAIQQMQRLVGGTFEFVVFTTIANNIEYLARLGITAKLWNQPVERTGVIIRRLFSRILEKFGHNPVKPHEGPFERMLIAENVDLVYFTGQSRASHNLLKLNYITTVWDLCHRDYPEFPEVSQFHEYSSRENLYSNLGSALLILTDSVELSKKISERYGVDKNRLLAMPYAPAPFTKKEYSLRKKDVLAKYLLNEGYYFYPANFWPHKNHVRFVEAMYLLKKEGINTSAVFSGADYGNLNYIINIVKSFDLCNEVKFLGFVPVEDMKGLYEGCAAVVMPTYFGPTNIPPLEAWLLGRPLIYSQYFAEQTGDAAFYVNPDDEYSLAGAMREVIKPEISKELIQKGYIRLASIETQRTYAEKELMKRLIQFNKRRECWTR